MRLDNNKVEEEIIEYLPFPECVRRRVGMYLGGNDQEACNTAYREITDNSTDEVAAGYGDTILLSTDFNGFCFVADNGRGIPISMSRDVPEKTSAYLSISELHTGSKFTSTQGVARVGINGVGSSSTAACSEVYCLLSKITEDNYNRSIPEVVTAWNEAGPRSKKDLYYVVIMEKGYRTFEGAGHLKDIEKKIFKGIKNYTNIPQGMSTIVLFKLDPEIFETIHPTIPVKNLQYFMLIQEKFFKRNVNVVIDGQSIKNNFKPFKFETIRTVIPKDNSQNKEVGIYLTFEADPELKSKEVFGSVNGLDCTGHHTSIAESLFKAALKDQYKIKHGFLDNGLKMCVVILANETIFDSQNKTRVKSIAKVKSTDFSDVVKDIEKVFRKNADYWDAHVEKLNYLADSMRNIGAIEKAQKIMDSAGGNGIYRTKGEMVEGFADATAPSSERWNCECFLTEGLSPAGSLKAARKAIDVKYRSVLPLRGKVLDTSDCNADKMMDNKEFFTIFSVMGLGISANSVIKDAKSPEEAYEIIKKKSRYGKLVIATDSDEDGLSIQKGILYTISKFARFMIDFGLVYIAESPIFEQNGKYFYPSDPRITGTQFCVGMDPSKKFRRFKGLGALESEDVYYSFYNENTRRLIQVTTEYIDYAMGLVEDINNRKQLLFNKGILTNPYNFTDL